MKSNLSFNTYLSPYCAPISWSSTHQLHINHGLVIHTTPWHISKQYFLHSLPTAVVHASTVIVTDRGLGHHLQQILTDRFIFNLLIAMRKALVQVICAFLLSLLQHHLTRLDEEMDVFINTAKLRLTMHHPSNLHHSGHRYYGYPLQTWQMYHRYCG